jgi:hypothetical protein
MEKTRPAFEASLKGIRVAVFDNETTDGTRRWYSCAPSRRFVEAGSQEAKYTATFNGIADLVLLRELINQAIAWMSTREECSEVE